jgi:hypothetical protein
MGYKGFRMNEVQYQISTTRSSSDNAALVDGSNIRGRRSGAYVRTSNKNTRQFDPGKTTNPDLNWQSDVLQRKWATSPLGSSSFSASFSLTGERRLKIMYIGHDNSCFRHKDRRSGTECQPTATFPPRFISAFTYTHSICSSEITGFRPAEGDGWDKTKEK